MTSPALSIGVILHDFALGGTERVALRLSRAWAARGARVTIFCGSTCGPLGALAGPDVEIVAAARPLDRRLGSRLGLARAGAAFFGRRRFDACFVPGNYHWPVASALAAIDGGRRPAIVAQVSSALDKPQRGAVRQAAFDARMRWLLRRADGVVAMSHASREQADRILGRQVATWIPLPAVEDDAPRPTSPPAGGRMIVAAGRLAPEKDFETLIEAFAHLGDPAARLVIVGAGPEEARLRRRAAERGVADQILLPGYVSDIRPWLDEARLFVLSSRFEGYAAVLVEALAAGRPVVSTACTHANAELLTETAFGRVVPVGDARAMAKAMGDLLAAEPPDPARLAQAVAHHRMGPAAEAYLDVFARLSPRRGLQ